MLINGIGIAHRGFHKIPHTSTARVTSWFNFLYLPIFPLSVYIVELEKNKNAANQLKILKRVPLVRSDVIKTYLRGWIFYPAFVLLPSFFAIREVWMGLGLPENFYSYYLGIAIGWLVVSFLLLLYLSDKKREL